MLRDIYCISMVFTFDLLQYSYSFNLVSFLLFQKCISGLAFKKIPRLYCLWSWKLFWIFELYNNTKKIPTQYIWTKSPQSMCTCAWGVITHFVAKSIVRFHAVHTTVQKEIWLVHHLVYQYTVSLVFVPVVANGICSKNNYFQQNIQPLS